MALMWPKIECFSFFYLKKNKTKKLKWKTLNNNTSNKEKEILNYFVGV